MLEVLFPGICSSLVGERIESCKLCAGSESTQPGGLFQLRLPWRNLSDSALSSWEEVWFPSFGTRGSWLLPLWLPLPFLPQLTQADFLFYLAPSGALWASLFTTLIQLIDKKINNLILGMGITHHSLRRRFTRCLRVACAHKQLKQDPEHFFQSMSIFDWRTRLHGSLWKLGG